MGVDFFACENCGETICDAGDFFRCECGAKFCSDECGARQQNGFIDNEDEGYVDNEDEDEEEEAKTTCVFCRFNISMEEAIKIHWALDEKKKKEKD